MSDDVVQSVRVIAGRYEIGETIGHGGMADVHLGTDTRLGRRVAVKLLHPELAADPAFRARFRREAHDAAKMTHPTIVRVYDAGEEATVADDGSERFQPFIVMEYVDGRLLRDIIADGGVTQEQAAKITEQVLVALEYSHRAGVIHRDIKPGNIMVTRTGQVKVMDFGIARAVSDSVSTIAETSRIVGTAQYFSPEQAKGEVVDARTDLYSTGVVLFELLTGKPPFEGETPVAVAYQHINAEPPIPSRVSTHVAPAFDLVVAKALAKDPARRYQSAAEFRADVVTAAAGELPVKKSARPDDFAETLFGSTQAAQAAHTAKQLQAESDHRAMRTQSGPPVLWLWAGIVAVLGIIAAVMYWIFTLQPTQIAPTTPVVPNVIGEAFDDAATDLEEAGLGFVRSDESSSTVPAGSVIAVIPEPGTAVEAGFEVQVVVSSGVKRLEVPSVTNLSDAEATATLEAAGFTVGAVTQSASPSVPGGQVIETVPKAGSTVTPDTAIDLVVSSGLVLAPDLTGQAQSQIGVLQEAVGVSNVEIRVDSSCSGGVVKAQSPGAGEYPQGTKFQIVVCP